MEKHQRLLGATFLTMYLVVFFLLYASIFDTSMLWSLHMNRSATKATAKAFHSDIKSAPAPPPPSPPPPPPPAKFHFQRLLRRLVRGEERKKLEDTGMGCHVSHYSEVCVTDRLVSIDTKTMTIHVQSSSSFEERMVRPYACLKMIEHFFKKEITPVHIRHENMSTCDYTHDVPAVIFSTGGFVGNQFHEFDETIVPLFITTHQLQSHVQFITVDHNPYFFTKYDQILSRMSNYEVINSATNGSVHCFPGVIVGLHSHGFLALNSSDLPIGTSMPDFKQFLREVYNLKIWTVSEIKKPILVLVSRTGSRTFLNEDGIVSLMKELGFKVVVTRPPIMSDLKTYSRLINSCSVMVGVHGAGLTNELFLPNGAVLVQVVPIGIQDNSDAFFGEPTKGMGLEYLEYKIELQESSLYKLYGRENTIITDPTAIKKDWKMSAQVYYDEQHVTIDLVRFRKTLVKALELVTPEFN